MSLKAKFFTVLLSVLIFVSSALFATWNIGDFVDDFEDPTGEHFLFTTVWGTFSNTATRKSDSPFRIIVYISDDEFPYAIVQLEPHTYDWDDPVDDFYDDSTAVIKIKDEKGDVHTFYTENSEDGHYWNYIQNEDAISIVDLFRTNNTVKIYIQIESYTFNYTLDCSDFVSVYDDFFPDVNLAVNEWSVSANADTGFVYATIVLSEFYEESYYLEIETLGDSIRDENPFVLSFNLYLEDQESGLYDNFEDSVEKIIFSSVSDNSEYMHQYQFDYTYVIDLGNIDWDGFCEVLGDGEELTIEVYTKDGDVLTFRTSGPEFLKYMKYPYDFLEN